VRGHADLAAFEPPAIADVRIRDLAARVDVRSDAAMNPRRPDDYPTAVVTVALRDGRKLTESTVVVRGDAAAPIDRAEVVAKFVALAAPVIGATRAQAVADAVDRIDELKDVRDLTALLAV